MNTVVGLITLLFLSSYGAEGLSCYCREKICAPLDSLKERCKGGLVLDPCHCCKTCAKLQGERCGGMFDLLGKCDEGLVCQGWYRNGICRLKNEAPPTTATTLPRKWQKMLVKTPEERIFFDSGDDGLKTVVTAQTQVEFEQPTEVIDLYSGDGVGSENTVVSSQPQNTEEELRTSPATTNTNFEKELSTTQAEIEQPTEVIDLYSGYGVGSENEKTSVSSTTQATTQEPFEYRTNTAFEEVLVTTQPETEQPTDVDSFSGDSFSGDTEDDDDDSKKTTQATQEPTEITELSYENVKTTRQPASESTTVGSEDIQIIF